MNTNVYTDPLYWDASPQGDNGTVGNTAIYSAAFGYNYSKLIIGDIEYIYRPSYSYSKCQTLTANNTINFNGYKTRHFNLQSNSLMENLYLHGASLSDSLQINLWNGYAIEPFIGGGFNYMSNFHSTKIDSVYTAIMQDNFRTSLAWQLSAGFQLINNTDFNLAAGYRYYNGGSFSSSNFIINSQDYSTPWEATLQANGFFRYHSI